MFVECTAENAASMNMFYCHKGNNECVSSSWKCDGTPDCEFGEDEEGCATGNKPSGGFKTFLIVVCLPEIVLLTFCSYRSFCH